MEILGTMASIIILISFTMKDIKKIRLINIIGSIIFIIYAIYIKSFSVCFLNSMMIFVHIYQLKKLPN